MFMEMNLRRPQPFPLRVQDLVFPAPSAPTIEESSF